jgi:hypothetical protein
MPHCTYLIRLPSSYYFRIRVPPDLQPVVGKKVAEGWIPLSEQERLKGRQTRTEPKGSN